MESYYYTLGEVIRVQLIHTKRSNSQIDFPETSSRNSLCRTAHVHGHYDKEDPDSAVAKLWSSRQAIPVHCPIDTLIGQKGERKVEAVRN